MILPIRIDKEELAGFCEKHYIIKLALFGSVLTDRFGPDSDVDVLVEFNPDHIPGLIALSGMERELSEILGRRADMRTPNDLSRYFRDEVSRLFRNVTSVNSLEMSYRSPSELSKVCGQVG